MRCRAGASSDFPPATFVARPMPRANRCRMISTVAIVCHTGAAPGGEAAGDLGDGGRDIGAPAYAACIATTTASSSHASEISAHEKAGPRTGRGPALVNLYFTD